MKCVSAVSFLAITFLIGLIVYVWVEFGTNPLQKKFENATRDLHTGKHKELIDRTHLDAGNDIEFIKPIKIAPPPLNNQDIIFDRMNNNNNNNKEKPSSKHHSGHFRHKSAEIWDPHPNYEIHAFGKKFLLELSLDSNFLSSDLHIVTHHGNYAEKVRHDPKLSACFYTGNVKGDPNSDVAVSLCHGMTGYIKTAKEAYHIEPAEKFHNNSINSILHRIKRIQHSAPLDSNDIFNSLSEEDLDAATWGPPLGRRKYEEKDHGTIVADDLPGETVEDHHEHVINKRAVPFDDLDTERTYAHLEFITAYSSDYQDFPPLVVSPRTTRDALWPRKISTEYHVEVLIVIDQSMLAYHRSEDELKHYVMTLMNHVSHLYKHASIGNAITISLVWMTILKNDSFSYSDSTEMLHKFCKWQEMHTKNINHDVAILLTRNEICRQQNKDCRTLGVAEVGSMCNSHTSCTIVVDKGLSTSYTIAHELGHVLSMPHDNDKKCTELNRGQGYMNIMNKIMRNDTKPWMWSKCSRHYLTEFLDTPKAKCLQNIPDHELQNNDVFMLPGEAFDVDRQCELEFGEGVKVCSFMTSCRQLWCTKHGDNKEREGCRTQHLPWAEGTRCDYNKWCYQGECTSENRTILVPEHGGWGDWQPWGPCSRSCGGGIQMSLRNCDSPPPSNGGNFCTGKGVKYMSCNTHQCDPKELDFRALQCAEFNGDNKNLQHLPRDVEWLPKYGLKKDEDLCKLYCRPKNNNLYYMLKGKVKDGTKCGLNSFDICVNGICRSAGCDNHLDSNIALDDCGVCGGDNSKCEKISGSYNRTSPGYNKVIRIPKGSSNIQIFQYSETHTGDDNYLALVDGDTGDYILNGGQKVITYAEEIIYGSLIINYSGTNTSVETITTPKHHKLTKDLLVEVLLVGNVPPSISYNYYINRDNAPRYGWRLYQKQWTKCDSICSGTEELRPICVDMVSGAQVDDNNCLDVDKNSFVQRRACNTHCQLTWNVLTKGPCSNHCGPGFREITYNCLKMPEAERVDEKHCSSTLSKPPLMEKCLGNCESTSRWLYGPWSECSKTCGGGYQMRTAQCVDREGHPLDETQCKIEEKVTQKQCKTEKCPQWVSSNRWSECSVTCGRGIKTQQFLCHLNYRVVDDVYCDQSTRPYETQECEERVCNVKWETTPWNECISFEPECGDGLKRRHVICKQGDDHVDDHYCNGILKPNDTATCNIECVPDYDYENEMGNSIVYYRWFIGDWGQCSKSCGGGYQNRQVLCRDDSDNIVGNHNCAIYDKPKEVEECNVFECPTWNFGRWSLCDSNCEQMRQVSCRNTSGSFLSDEHCDRRTKPVTVQKCPASECRLKIEPKKALHYKWKVGKWRQCNTKCGRGSRRRQVECKDLLNNVTVVDSFCNLQRKPKLSQPCELYIGHNCHQAWIIGDWSSCSRSCGEGFKDRNVTCHKVLAEGVIHPEPIDIHQTNPRDYCPLYNKPKSRTKCLVSRCSDEFIWTTGPWSQCSNRCGTPDKQIRKLYCLHKPTNRRVGRKFCPRNLRPLRRKKCPKKPCIYRNCKEIQHYRQTRDNKDYTILIGDKLAVVYCYKMDTAEPEEYITLHPSARNFAEFYEKRLIELDTCPYGGARRDNCNCDVIGDRPGLTSFWKIRVNITTMKIEQDDFTFSNNIKGKSIAYGTAGDCYSRSKGCPQGQFSIDLTSTSFKISDNVRWIQRDPSGTSRINLNRAKTIVEGACGGYCGVCEPDPHIGLKLEVT